MTILRKAAAVTGALVLASLPSTALAHDGAHPFARCADAHEAGYSNIPKGDKHYGEHLDRDKDGIGCDNPPKDFTPAPDEDTAAPAPTPSEKPNKPSAPAAPADDELAETGGDDTTRAVAVAGAAALLLGGGVVIATKRKRATNN
jgi:LPXTG-motif cell wall-anchored protein